jgi:hypothetical protein
MALESYCPGCGAPRAVGARFCPSCGRPLADIPVATPVLTGVTPASPAVRQRTSPALLLLVVVTGVLAVAVFAYAIGPGGLIRSQTALATPTVGPTLQPTPTATDVAVVTDAPAFTAPPAEGGLNLTAGFGEPISLQDTSSGTSLGSVTVVKIKKYTALDYITADKGKTYVGVDVRYDAVSGFSYNPFDWVAHDATGAQYEYDGNNISPELSSGTLAAGRHREGWISFQVAKTLAHLWIDYQNSDGTVVFTVKLY